MTDPLAAARPGERWVVRLRQPDGSATDVVGWVIAAESETLAIARVGEPAQTVRRAEVLVARRVPAARGGPDPGRASAAEVEWHAVTGWRADWEPLGEWTLRAGRGFTGRANSAHAVGDPGMPLAEAAGRVVAYAAQHGIVPAATVVTGSTAEQALRDLGWTDTYVPVDVLVARLADVLGAEPPPPGVRVTETLEPAWEEAYRRMRPPPDDPTIARRILDGNPPRAFATMTEDGAVVAIGRCHVTGAWSGMAAVWTDPDHRRAGLASRVMAALGHWAARRGARYAYVQVDAANTAALTAYARLGFTRHHSYLYLAPPADQSGTQRTRSVGA